MEELWIVTSEILVQRDYFPSGNTKAFVNVVTWANSSNMAKSKVSRCLESYGWHLISIEDSHPVDDSRIYEEDIAEIIDRVRGDPSAVICGRAFSYKGD